MRDNVFASVSEELEWQYVVETNPRKPGEGQMEYVRRICELAQAGAGRGRAPTKEHDAPWLPYKDPA